MFFSATNRLHQDGRSFSSTNVRQILRWSTLHPSSRDEFSIKCIKSILLIGIKEQRLTIATTNFQWRSPEVKQIASHRENTSHSFCLFRALISAISVHYLAKKREEKERRNRRETTSKYQMTEEEVLELADQTARQYQIFLGLDTLCLGFSYEV